jgi:hypothetical protein
MIDSKIKESSTQLCNLKMQMPLLSSFKQEPISPVEKIEFPYLFIGYNVLHVYM